MPLLPEAQHAIQAALDALDIDGLPTSLQAGEIVTPRLRPDPLQALAPLALGERVLASLKLPLENLVIPITLPTEIPIKLPFNVPLNLDATLDQIGLNATGTNPGEVDLGVVSKAVQFQPPALTPDGGLDLAGQAVDRLPHLVPTGVAGSGLPLYTFNDRVQGFLGKVTGVIRQIQGFTGSIAGKVGGTLGGPATFLETTIQIPNVPTQITIPSLIGAITTPQLLPKAPTVSVKWIVQDDSGNELPGNRVAIFPNATVVAPSLVFLPEFTELTGIGLTTSKRRIFCEVTISVDTGVLPDGTLDLKNFSRTLGPFTIDIPRIPVPTVMAMIQHGVGDVKFPGGVLVAVPSTSLIRGLDEVRSLLEPVRTTLNRLRTLASVIGMVTFGEAADYLDQVLALLDTADPKPPAFRKQDRVSGLNDVTMRPGGLLGFGRESFEDNVSSVLLIGPPGRSVKVYRMRNFSEEVTHTDQGVFEMKVGPTAVAFVPNLRRAYPIEPIPCLPEGSRFIEHIHPSDGRWNDRISSYQFLPL